MPRPRTAIAAPVASNTPGWTTSYGAVARGEGSSAQEARMQEMEKRMTVRMEGVEKKVTSMVSQVESLMLKVQEKLTAQLRAPEGDTVDAMVDASESERLAAGATVGGMQIMGTEWDKIVATVELSKEYADAKKKSGTEAEMVKKAMVFDEYQKSVARAATLDRLNSVVPSY